MTTPQKTMRPPTPTLQAARFQLHWLSVVRMLWKGKATLLAIWLVLSVVAVAWVRRLPAYYKAEALILIVSPRISEKYVTSVNYDPQEQLGAISHVVLSKERLEKIIETYGLYQNERKALSQDEVIERMHDDDITLKLEAGVSSAHPDAFRISYQAKDPRIAAQVANGLANLIINENDQVREDRATDTSEFIQDQLKQAKQTLNQLEERVGEYKLAHNGDLPEQATSLNLALSRFQVKLQGTQEALNRADQNRTLLEGSLQVAESSLSALEQTAKQTSDEAHRKGLAQPQQDPLAPPAHVKTRREALQEELASLQSRYGEEHPEIKRRKAELAALPPDPPDADPVGPAKPAGTNPAAGSSGPEAAILANLATSMINQRERIAGLQAQLGATIKDFTSATAERTEVLRQIDDYQSRIDKIPVREQEIAVLTRDYEVAKENYKSLLDKKLATGMAADLEHSQEGEKFTLIDAARVPEKPFKPNRLLLYSLGVVLGLLIGAFVVLGRQLHKDTLLGEWEMIPGTVILGRVPQIKAPKKLMNRASSGALT